MMESYEKSWLKIYKKLEIADLCYHVNNRNVDLAGDGAPLKSKIPKFLQI